jgi:hypothetical protein
MPQEKSRTRKIILGGREYTFDETATAEDIRQVLEREGPDTPPPAAALVPQKPTPRPGYGLESADAIKSGRPPSLLDRLLERLWKRSGDQAPVRPTPDAEVERELVQQGRVDRHRPGVERDQENADADHYLVGREMGGPQNPMHERIGAALPFIAAELARPLTAPAAKPTNGYDPNALMLSKTGQPAKESDEGDSGLVDALNQLLSTPDQPIWLKKGESGALAEPYTGPRETVRNLEMLARGATGAQPPNEMKRRGAETIDEWLARVWRGEDR